MKLNNLIKKEIIILSTTIVTLTIGFFAFTYAIYFRVLESSSNTVSYGNFAIEVCEDSECSNLYASGLDRIIGLSDNTTFLSHMYPVTEEEALEMAPYAFVVKNTGDIDGYVTINMSSNWAEENIGSNMLNYYANMHYAIRLASLDTYNTSTFNSGGLSQIIATDVFIPAGGYKIFYFWVWADEKSSNDLIDSIVLTKLNVTGYMLPEDASNIIENSNFTLTVNLDGGFTTQTFSNYYANGTDILLINPIKTGYEFVTWDVKGIDSDLSPNNILTIGKGNVTLTAKWRANKYKIIYNLSGGSFTSSQVSEMEYDKVYNIENPIKDGYTFIGWKVTNGLNALTARVGMSSSNVNTSISNSSSLINMSYFKNLSTTSAADVTLTAYWEEMSSSSTVIIE